VIPLSNALAAPRHVYSLGLDLGQVADYSALAVARHGAGRRAPYDVGFLERWQGKPYPWVVERTGQVVEALRQASVRELPPGTPPPCFFFAIDATGVGRAVVDLFAQARTSDRLRFAGVELAAITITGGTAVTEDGEGFRVPKRDLASAVQALLQEERVKVAPALPLARTLLDELVGFRVKIDRATGHDSYGAGEDWRSAPHDDLVLALAMALWWGEWRARVADGGSVDVTEQLRAAPPEQSRSVGWGGASGA
jgi:hypothetical protein